MLAMLLTAACSTDRNCTAIGEQPAQHYVKQGSIDVGTFENTIFYWAGRLLNLENIPCSYWDHAGIWEPSYGNHSYARVRDFVTGDVIANISSTSTFGFVSAFPDYETGILWLFGTPADRCINNGSPTTVQAWWTTDASLQVWETALAFDFGHPTHNVQVGSATRRGSLPIPHLLRSPTGSTCALAGDQGGAARRLQSF